MREEGSEDRGEESILCISAYSVSRISIFISVSFAAAVLCCDDELTIAKGAKTKKVD